MNKRIPPLLVAAMLATAYAHGDLKPAHGGVIAEGKQVVVELVVKTDRLDVYLTDHVKAIDAKGASGQVILLSGGTKTEARLLPAAGNLLSVQGNFKLGAGAKAIVKVSIPGKGEDQIRLSLP
ncbi:hypothetical protein [Chitinimonas lacunae]|uniref:Copper-binding protein n=1 Tax=Chitinimonas lacunae TaxID=1963018 RepID=A0ABV8MT91_9NEIS